MDSDLAPAAIVELQQVWLGGEGTQQETGECSTHAAAEELRPHLLYARPAGHLQSFIIAITD